MSQLANKIAFVTGAGSGIGAIIATTFAHQGASVVVADIDLVSGHRTAEQITSQTGKAMAIQMDVTQEASVKVAIEAVQSRFGRLDSLVNCAGITFVKPLLETTDEDFDRVINVNLRSVMLVCKHAVPLMENNGGGSIINIGSLSGLRARPDMPLYVASKGGVIALTKSLAIDLARKGIRANCICPVATDTPMLQKYYRSIENGAAKRAATEASIPLGRLARAEDIAELALYLAGNSSSYVSGQIIAVDGGCMAGTLER